MAPGLGLYLSELFFEGYNSKQHRAIQHSLVKQQQSAGSSESSRKNQKTDESVVAPATTAVDNVGILSISTRQRTQFNTYFSYIGGNWWQNRRKRS